MTSNLAECINFVLKGIYHLSVISVVKETYFHLTILFSKQATVYARQIASDHTWCNDVMKEIR